MNFVNDWFCLGYRFSGFCFRRRYILIPLPAVHRRYGRTTNSRKKINASSESDPSMPQYYFSLLRNRPEKGFLCTLNLACGWRKRSCYARYPTLRKTRRMGHPVRMSIRVFYVAYFTGVVVFTFESLTRAFSSLCCTLATSAGSASAGREWAYSDIERSHWATAIVSLPVFS